jgi:hypothetical protein
MKNVVSIVERFNDRSIWTLEFNLDRQRTTSYGICGTPGNIVIRFSAVVVTTVYTEVCAPLLTRPVIGPQIEKSVL